MKERSYLFVPADRVERFAKAMQTAAGAVVLDLEDAVAPECKTQARTAVAQWLRQHRPDASQPKLLLRVNDATTEWHQADCELLQAPGLAGVMLPKAEAPEAVLQLSNRLRPGQQMIPLIETVKGLDQARRLAEPQAVPRLAFGSVDFCIDAGMESEDEPLHFVRTSLVLQSRLAGKASPIDGVTVDFRDTMQLRQDVARSRAFGFGAKLCIHPAQIEPINVGYAPQAEAIAWAERVVAAVAQQGRGAIAVDGKLIDKPLLLKARGILQAAG